VLKQPELPDFYLDLEIEQALNQLARLGGLIDGGKFPPDSESPPELDNVTSS